MNLKKRKIIRVCDVMKTEIDIVNGMMTVSEALKSLKYPDTRTILVDKRHKDDEYGVVMFRDVARRVARRAGWRRKAVYQMTLQMGARLREQAQEE